MIHDIRQFAASSELRTDVCVVGSGAAGTPLSLELGRAGVDVVMIEAGGKKWSRHNQDFYRGEILNPEIHGELHDYRHRRLGGTTTVWGGRCIPFDEIDFQFRSHVSFSGWPIDRKELIPYYIKAHNYLHLGQFAYRVTEALPGAPVFMVPGLRDNAVVTNNIERFSLPTNFGHHYNAELGNSPHVHVFLNANCFEIETDEVGRRVTGICVRTTEGTTHFVRAKAFVLCAGGLEITRLLLLSNKVHGAGLGNQSGRLGRFYMSHLSGIIAEVVFTTGPIVYDFEKDPDGVYCRRRFAISERAQRDNRLLNFSAFLHHGHIENPDHGSGFLSAIYLAKKLRYISHRIPPEYSKRLSLEKNTTKEAAAHVRNVLRDLPHICFKAPELFYKRMLAERKLPSLIIKSPTNRYHLHYHVEQSPNPESRVDLSLERDALGVPRLRVDFRYTELDINSIIRAHKMIGKSLREFNCGYLRFLSDDLEKDIKEQVSVGGHHIGTTRMAKNSSEGVVDENCRVHGISNLFVASSAVFPTSGQANPTLTIVAIALRVANHLLTVLPDLESPVASE